MGEGLQTPTTFSDKRNAITRDIVWSQSVRMSADIIRHMAVEHKGDSYLALIGTEYSGCFESWCVFETNPSIDKSIATAKALVERSKKWQRLWSDMNKST